ncbi:MAG: gliding motility-associated C-terminal domain-containing protein, partial [Bacteroidetes bacterium]|nr:gliding motility-associated C-terminal domain-containing protein [Bacteroidota bacterium]
ANATGLGVALYTVTVTDANLCTATDTTSLFIPGGPTLTTAIDNEPSCVGSADARATVSITSGTSPYIIDWPGTTNDTTISTVMTEQGVGLSAQTYTITVTDINSCSAVATVTPVDPLPVTVTANGVNPLCFGSSDGDLTSLGGGGTGTITYNWNILGAGQDHIGTVASGTYTVTATDANGCTATDQTTLTDPLPLTVTATSSSPLCYEDCDGTIEVTPGGGTGAYTFIWNDGATTEDRDSLCGDTARYYVTVTDNNSCVAIDSANVTRPAEVIALIAVPSEDTTSTSPFTVNFENGSTGADTYLWDFGDDETGITSNDSNTSYTYVNATIISYTVVLTASQGGNCPKTDSTVVTISCEDTLSAPDIFTPNGDEVNDRFMVKHKGINNIKGMIFNRWGEKLYQWAGVETGWDGRTIAGEQVPDGVYYYLITAIGCTGQEFDLKHTVTIIR